MLVASFPPHKIEGVILEVHGGSFRDGPGAAQYGLSVVKARWNKRGWAVYSTSYADKNGPKAIQNVVHSFDFLRHKYPQKKLIVVGQSAGGTFALQLAAHRQPYAVIAEAPAVDLTDPNLSPDAKAAVAAAWPDPSFYSPINLRPPTRALLSANVADPHIPYTQTRDYARAHHLQFLRMHEGDHPYTHANTADSSWFSLMQLERKTAGITT